MSLEDGDESMAGPFATATRKRACVACLAKWKPGDPEVSCPHLVPEEPSRPLWVDKNGSLSPDRAAFVERLERNEVFASMLDTGEMLRYHGGVYNGHAERFIDDWVEAQFKLKEQTATSHFRSETTWAVRARSYVERGIFNEPGFLCLDNGVLDIKTQTLLTHHPSRRFTYQIHVRFDAKATCPVFDAFMVDSLPDERTRELALEAIGYALTPTNPHQVAFVLVGDGENGKSTYLGTLGGILGSANVAAETLQQLSDGRFASAELLGKMVNLAADIPDAPIRHTGTFKMLTGGDLISAERKGRDPFKYVWGGKAFFSCNRLPEVDDDTHAFWRRMIVLSFNVRVEEGKKDPNLLDKLMAERPGILNRALEALRRLEARGKFDMPATVASVEAEWERKSNSLKWFLRDRCARSPTSWVTKQDFMVAYSEFCQEQGVITKDNREVGMHICQWMPGVRASVHRIAGRLCKCWDGLELVNPQARLSEVSDSGQTNVATDTGDTGDTGGNTSHSAREKLVLDETTRIARRTRISDMPERAREPEEGYQ